MRIRGTKEEVSEKKRQFGIWLGIPNIENETLQDIAKRIGVHSDLLSKWKKDPEVTRARDSAVKLNFSGDRLRLFLDSMDEGLAKANPSSQRLFAEISGLLEPKAGRQAPVEIIIKHGTKENRNSD